MRFAGVLALVWVPVLAGCGHKPDDHGETPVTGPVAPSPNPTPGNADPDPSLGPSQVQARQPAPPPEFPDTTRSLELRRTLTVRLEPGTDGKPIGTIGVDTRVAWKQTRDAKGCTKKWIEIEPRGWICGDHVIPSKKAPYGQEVPHLERGEIVPGVYGKVTAANQVTYILEKPDDPAKKRDKKDKKDRKKPKGPRPVTSPRDIDDDDKAPLKAPRMAEDKPLVGSINVRDYDEVTVDGKTYWKIAQKDNQYVLASSVSRHTPSKYVGSRLGDETGYGVPFAFVWPRGGMVEAYTTNKANGGGVNRQLAARTAVPVLGVENDKAGKPTAYRIGESEWMSAQDVKVFTPLPPPKLLKDGERWIDVDLDAQILVAYEGDTPVYATLVTSGAKDTPTKTGTYRIWRKESEADMNGLNGEDPYSVATVPWTQYFSVEDKYALHTSYWHDAFGRPRSHGCVNLSPRDARWLYFWSDPQVPAGWTMSAGVVEAPGSIVRVRTAADPDPEVRGYAKKVVEARRANQ